MRSASGFRLSRIGPPSLPDAGKLLLYDYESLTNFVQQRAKVRRQNNFLGIDHNVRTRSRPRSGQPHRFTKTAFHAVALHCPSKGTPYRKPNAKPSLPVGLALGKKHGHRGRKVPPPQLVYALEVGVAQKSSDSGEPSNRSRFDTMIRCSGHTGGHNAS